MSNRAHHRQSLADLIEGFRQDTRKEEWTARDVAAWAVNNELYDVPFASKVAALSRELGEHLTKETCLSSRGGKMRKYACVRTKAFIEGKEQSVFSWTDARYGKPTFMLASFRLRHRGVRGDVRSLQADVEEWNACYRPADMDPIELNWDFSEPHGDEQLGAAS